MRTATSPSRIRRSSATALGAAMLALAASAYAAPPKIYVAYPKTQGTSVAFDHVLFEGSVTPGATLTVSGRRVAVGADGLFIEWLPLSPGLNTLQLEAKRGSEISKRMLAITSAPLRPLPAAPTAIDAASLAPGADLVLYGPRGAEARPALRVAFRGSPGGAATFKVGERGPFPMTEQRTEDFPGTKYLQPGFYEGALFLSGTEEFSTEPVTVTLMGADGSSVSATAPGKITARAGAQPRVAIVTAETPGLGANPTTSSARNGPGRSPILWLRQGVKLLVVGEDTSTYTARIAPGQHVSVPKESVRLLPEGTPHTPRYFSRIESRRVGGGTQIRFALPDRVPFSITQSASSTQSLALRLFDTETDVDYMTSDAPDPLVRGVRWRQEQDGVLAVDIELASRQQWGHHASYEGNTLVLFVRDAPKIQRQNPLRGHRILIDPGHGGSESGAPGAFGTPEKEIVLDISRRLHQKLRAAGADSVLSRESDVRVPLGDRPLLAEKIGAELLVSIHANALPDGVDPRTQRGTAVYYFQPQARALSETLLSSLTKSLPEAGSDGLHFQNLALTRPTSQPSVLVETAFLTDKGNLRLLSSPQGRERFAQALARGLEEFYRQNATR